MMLGLIKSVLDRAFTGSSNWAKRELSAHYYLAAICGGAISLWLVHSLLHLHRKVPQSNEVMWLLSHESLYLTGTTSFQVDQIGPLSHGNWHPPLMWLVTQPFFALGFDALQSFLAINFISGLVTIGATWWLGFELARHVKIEPFWLLGALSVALLCTIPLFQAGTGILDIDNGLLTAAMTLYLAVLFSIKNPVSLSKLLLLGVVLSVTLLTKISTSLILMPLTLIYFWERQGRFRSAIVSSSVSILVMLALFFAVYSVTRPFFEGDWHGPFTHNSASVLAKASGQNWDKWISRVRTLAELSLWIGPSAGVLLLASLLWFGRSYLSRYIQTIVPGLLLIYVLGIWGSYSYLGVTFNLRYMIPSLPVLAVIVPFFLVRQGTLSLRGSNSWKPMELLAFALLFGIAFFLLPDPILYIKSKLKADFWPALLLYIGALFTVSLAAYLLLWWLRKRGIKIANMFVAWLVCIWLVFNLNTSVKQMLGNYQLSYGYGLSEYNDVVQWLQEHGQGGAPIVASKDFVWLLRGAKLQIYEEGRLDQVVYLYGNARGPLHYYQVLPVRYSKGPEQAWVESMKIGSEEVYRNKDFQIVKKSF
jgi:4-amino-4-deoxy-L-arabinose transferase-like glycosyltransferase